jgi:hypothetical protein
LKLKDLRFFAPINISAIFVLVLLCSCNFFGPSNASDSIKSLSADSLVLKQGQISCIHAELSSSAGVELSDTITLSTTLGYFVSASDSTRLGTTIKVLPVSEGKAEAYLLNPFSLEEDTSWVEATLGDRTKRIPVIFIPDEEVGALGCAIT